MLSEFIFGGGIYQKKRKHDGYGENDIEISLNSRKDVERKSEILYISNIDKKKQIGNLWIKI